MKVSPAAMAQNEELQRQARLRMQADKAYQMHVQEKHRTEIVQQIKNQELQTERNRRLGNDKGQNVDVEC